jgi:hypothetical protein
MLARVSAGFCSVCGAVLRDGVCPHGHPQRASRLRDRGRSGRAGRTFAWIILLLFVAGVAYGGLVWYPEQAATDLMRPSSEDFAVSVDVYRSTMAGFPPGPTDPQALIDASAGFVAAVGPTREELTRASARLEERQSADLPVISSRQPLRQARVTRDRMLDFYTSALETLASVEGVAGYLTLVGPVLPVLDNLEQALGTPGQDEVAGAVAAATPIADQILADLRAITPPEELGGLHATLVAIAERIRLDLDEIARAGREGTEQVVRALVQDVQAQIVTFREAVGAAPRDAGRSGLDDRTARVDELTVQVTAELEALRDRYGITELTIPSIEPAPATGV